MDEWQQISSSNIYYRKVDGALEMRCNSPAFPLLVALVGISAPIGLWFLISSIMNPYFLFVSIPYIILLVILPGYALPQVPNRHHLIIDDASTKLVFLKKNFHDRVISKKSFSANDLEDIIIRVFSSDVTSYSMLLRFNHNGNVKITTHNRLNVIREVEAFFRSHIQQLSTTTTQLECADVAVPIQSRRVDSPAPLASVLPASHESGLYCIVDHTLAEGVVYTCPGCHAMLCSACLSVYVSKAMGCPCCGRPVLASKMLKDE